MNKKNIKKAFLFVLIFLCILFIITAAIYLNNVKIHEDLTVELKGGDYSPKINIVGITALNDSFDLPLSHPNTWQIRNAYFKKLLIKIEDPNGILKNINVVINGKSFTYDFFEIKHSVYKNKQFIKELPYQSSGSIMPKALYVSKSILNRLLGFNIYLNLLFVFIFYVIALWLIWKLSQNIIFRNKYVGFLNKTRIIKYSWLEIAKVLFFTILLLSLTEKVFLKYNESNKTSFTIDPLLGYSFSKDAIKNIDCDLSDNMILLKTRPTAKDIKRVKILITGGSTSDLTYDVENWPVYLLKLLEEKNYAADIYVGAVTGYNSGQELMKLLSDGLLIKPDVHISYSGINDVLSASYVSPYEQNNYNKTVKNKNPLIMPNTYNAFIPGRSVDLNIVERNEADNVAFFLNNICLMNSVAERNHFVFIGILQPYNDFKCVIGTLLDVFDNPNDLLILCDSIKNSSFYNENTQQSFVSEFYHNIPHLNSKQTNLFNILYEKWPERAFYAYYGLFRTKLFYRALDSRLDSTAYIYNFTNIFSNTNKNPFKDRCHIKSEFQPIVAVAILRILEEKGIFCNKMPKNKDL